MGLTVDSGGAIDAVTGNGTFTDDGVNSSNSVIKLISTGNALVLADFFTRTRRAHLRGSIVCRMSEFEEPDVTASCASAPPATP